MGPFYSIKAPFGGSFLRYRNHGPARFGWKETKAVQRRDIGVAPVSEVRSALLNQVRLLCRPRAEMARRIGSRTTNQGTDQIRAEIQAFKGSARAPGSS